MALIAATAMSSSPTLAAGVVDEPYVKSLAAAGKTVLVIEYYDGNRKVVGRQGFASATGFKAASPTDIRVDDKVRLHLYGVEPCAGEMVNRKENFAGRCDDFAQTQLEILLRNPKVLFCRAFVSEEHAPTQDATCFGYYNFPGTLDTVENLEEQLVSLGALRLAKKPDGLPMRPDLAEAEKIGRSGFGMWADPRVQGQ
ncbi:hypothetical protein EFB14_24040 [Rhizobium fabae]|uniref:Nuclease n=2 Tax=Rhizobium fabae TaxID=573179 RepID=A0A7W6BGR6_9HYPH|nr:hypothetical protein [Rhizobium fabae]MBB3917206.1 hypothetical protein [Rhizobium fabae]RUM10315.1 hypothetical protein EFB14_24040 [Rhizobium fabae]